MEFGISKEEFEKIRNDLIVDEKSWIHQTKKRYNISYIGQLIADFKVIEPSTGSEVIFRIKNSIFETPICPVCKINKVPFRIKNRGYQDTCSVICSRPGAILKIEATNLERYGCKNVFGSKIIQERIADTNLERYGFINASKNEEVKQRGVETCNLKYGTDNAMSAGSPIRAEVEERNLEKFGVKDAWNTDEARKKTGDTNEVRYGVRNVLQKGSPFLPIIEATNLERYGCKYPTQNVIVKEKILKTWLERHKGIGFTSPSINKTIEQTNLERRGVTNPYSCKLVIEQIHQTFINNWGDKHFKQSSKYWEESSTSDSYKKTHKSFILPSGKIIHIQGYEGIALLVILKTYSEEEILTAKWEVPEIWYFQDEKKKRYYPDIYIPRENLIIEVKSEYTYNASYTENILKAQACIDAGYNYEFWICSKNDLLKIINYKETVQ